MSCVCIQPCEEPPSFTALLTQEQISVPLGVGFACRKFAYWNVEEGFGNLERVV